jgi:hypothetical protein
MKVVINACFGGFDLSDAAIRRYAEIKGIEPYPMKGPVLYSGDLERNDPALVQVVEELVDAANGYLARLSIVEIPNDVEWEISEYDGYEHVVEKHRTWP